MNLKNTKIIHGQWFLAVCWPAVLGLAAPLVANAAIDIHEGQWKTVIGMTIENPDLPFAMPSVKFMTSTCITQKDAVPNTAQENQKCETTDYKLIGSTVSWTSRCVDKISTTEGSGEISYKHKTYEGSMHMTKTPSDPRIRPVNMIYILNGNYVGECER
ncbi:MAG: DUF3617 domain-containing protein [Candidatus Binatales bacterium]